MWYAQETEKLENVNEQFRSLKGELDNREARISLAKFLRANLGLTTELISGIKLAPFQEIMLKGMLNKNFSMLVLGRGCGKTFIASVFCFLQCIFEPGTKILIAGPTFRTARFIFNNLEKMVESKGAELLAQAFGAKAKRNDQFEWQINGGSITAIPLNGEKIRGFRANILVLDEYLLLPEDIINNVLMPFLVAPQNMKERLEIREIEDELIRQGAMKEEDRMVFENNSKMIALSSASYTFENLYKTYKEWLQNIYSKEQKESSYFISQLSYESLPEEMIDTAVIEAAKEGGTSNASFQREYCAQFTDGSDSYFSAKKMHECTIPDGEHPTTKIRGDSELKYICAIDPSFSNSPTSDYFAMSVMELNQETNTSTLVHGYAVAGGDLKDHIQYFEYLCDAFDFEMICIDNAGFQFIDSCNESKTFTKNLDFFEFNSDAEGINYEKEIRRARKEYNKEAGKICYKQIFTSNWLRKANEHLQASIDHKRLWFASKATASTEAFNRMTNQTISYKYPQGETVLDLIEEQDNLIYQTKKQCALIEVKSTAKGTQTFDLPQHLKRNTSVTRARRDNYTTLMIGNWAVKCYYDMMSAKDDAPEETFTPMML
tara:strand:+ start:301 stop:2112 length:1812 start_codon:yes stop_codon:yes gene_type:complete